MENDLKSEMATGLVQLVTREDPSDIFLCIMDIIPCFVHCAANQLRKLHDQKIMQCHKDKIM